MADYCFGIDVHKRFLNAELRQMENCANRMGNCYRTEDGGKEILPDVAKAICEKMQEKGITRTGDWCGRRCSGACYKRT